VTLDEEFEELCVAAYGGTLERKRKEPTRTVVPIHMPCLRGACYPEQCEAAGTCEYINAKTEGI
jgi:hypothetical protein